jgi:predicted nucleic acid-binding protein
MGDARRLLRNLPRQSVFVPVQALGELFAILVSKERRPRLEAATAILGWRTTFQVVETSDAVMLTALELATQHQL